MLFLLSKHCKYLSYANAILEYIGIFVLNVENFIYEIQGIPIFINKLFLEHYCYFSMKITCIRLTCFYGNEINIIIIIYI